MTLPSSLSLSLTAYLGREECMHIIITIIWSSSSPQPHASPPYFWLQEKELALGKMPFFPSLSLSLLCFVTFLKLINHKAIDYKIISSPFTSYLLFCSAKKVLYPSAPFAFITHFSRYGPSRVITHNHNHNNSLSLSLSHTFMFICVLSTSERTTLFLVSK